MKTQPTLLKMLSVIFMCTAATSTFSMTPDDGENLYLYTKSTKEAVVYSLNELDKITFGEKGIQIWNTSWPTEYAYSNVRVLTFSKTKTPTGIAVTPTPPPTDEGSVLIFDIQGRRLNYPKRGVNIIRLEDGTTRKVIIK